VRRHSILPDRSPAETKYLGHRGPPITPRRKRFTTALADSESGWDLSVIELELDEKGVRGDRLRAPRTSAGRIGAGKRIRATSGCPACWRWPPTGPTVTAIVQIDGRELRSGETKKR
jgi:hypothetical protein